ncbi:MAG: cytochrome c [Acidobacteria bacterium]|nr:cytochrome c [Acidobacteriota bacterium]
MKHFLTFTVTILTLFVLSGNALAEGDAQAGKAVFDTKCKACHGADAKGNPAIAKVMKATLPDMTSKEFQGKPDDEFKKQINEGSGKMKPVKGLSDQQIADVIAFIRSLAKS